MAQNVKINPEIFREYDIRGIVGTDLTPEIVELLGKAYGTYIQQQSGRDVIVGRDNRLSSEEFRDALVRGLVSTGCHVVDIGLVVTPIFYFSRVHYGIDGGVMVTASHNPPEFNGFKLARGFGTLHGEEIQEIGRLMERGSFIDGEGSVEYLDPVQTYFDDIWGRITLGPRRLKVVVDAGNGTAGLFAPTLLRGLGCEVIPLHCESDPNFPHHFPDPVKLENLQDLINLVKLQGADVGLSFDGDGDRIGVVDSLGNVIWGDMLMILYWREILAKHPGADVIVEVKCSQALVDEVRRLGGRPTFYRTGHSLIKAKMKEMGAVFTGEMSGHMFFADEYYGYDDALYAAARLLRIISHSDKDLMQLLADVPRYYSTPETRVDCPDDKKFKVVQEMQSFFKKSYEVVDIDGARVLFPDGWGLIRASNTQPALVLRAEANSPERLSAIKREIESALNGFPFLGSVKW